MKRRIKSSLLSLLVLLCTLFGAACSPVQAPPASNTAETAAPQADHFEYAAVPAYAGEPYAVINGNLKEDGGRASIRKKPEQNAGNQSSKLYPSGRYPDTGLFGNFCIKNPL